jgi:hypothetical protein
MFIFHMTKIIIEWTCNNQDSFGKLKLFLGEKHIFQKNSSDTNKFSEFSPCDRRHAGKFCTSTTIR